MLSQLLNQFSKRETTLVYYKYEIAIIGELLLIRLIATLDWIMNNPDTENLSVGLFGAGTDATAAVVAAAEGLAFVPDITKTMSQHNYDSNNKKSKCPRQDKDRLWQCFILYDSKKAI